LMLYEAGWKKMTSEDVATTLLYMPCCQLSYLLAKKSLEALLLWANSLLLKNLCRRLYRKRLHMMMTNVSIHSCPDSCRQFEHDVTSIGKDGVERG
jgi:hypothetical protein